MEVPRKTHEGCSVEYQWMIWSVRSAFAFAVIGQVVGEECDRSWFTVDVAHGYLLDGYELWRTTSPALRVPPGFPTAHTADWLPPWSSSSTLQSHSMCRVEAQNFLSFVCEEATRRIRQFGSWGINCDITRLTNEWGYARGAVLTAQFFTLTNRTRPPDAPAWHDATLEGSYPIT